MDVFSESNAAANQQDGSGPTLEQHTVNGTTTAKTNTGKSFQGNQTYDTIASAIIVVCLVLAGIVATTIAVRQLVKIHRLKNVFVVHESRKKKLKKRFSKDSGGFKSSQTEFDSERATCLSEVSEGPLSEMELAQCKQQVVMFSFGLDSRHNHSAEEFANILSRALSRKYRIQYFMIPDMSPVETLQQICTAGEELKVTILLSRGVRNILKGQSCLRSGEEWRKFILGQVAAYTSKYYYVFFRQDELPRDDMNYFYSLIPGDKIYEIVSYHETCDGWKAFIQDLTDVALSVHSSKLNSTVDINNTASLTSVHQLDRSKSEGHLQNADIRHVQEITDHPKSCLTKGLKRAQSSSSIL